MAKHTIRLEDVARAAALAHLSPSEERLSELQGELAAILDYVSLLDELDTDDVRATRHPLSPSSPLREDVVCPSLPREEVLSASPASRDGGFSVPRVLEVEK